MSLVMGSIAVVLFCIMTVKVVYSMMLSGRKEKIIDHIQVLKYLF